jgi:very-short-patch-repair endonuclease
MHTIDRVIAQIAVQNNWVVSWRHLVARSVSRRAVAHRARVGRLYRIHHGVYLLEPATTASRLTLFTAAVYACAPNAFLSHQSAAELWGLTKQRPGPIHVVVVGRNPGMRRNGIRIHRTTTLTRKHVRHRHRVPITSPARTIADLAPSTAADELELLIATARRKGLISDRELRALVKHDPAFTRSKAEQLFLRLIRQANLPEPRANFKLEGLEVDLYWPEHKLVVEFDSWEFHKDRAAFERDRARDAKLTAAGYRVIRITWRALTERPLETITRIAQALIQQAA